MPDRPRLADTYPSLVTPCLAATCFSLCPPPPPPLVWQMGLGKTIQTAVFLQVPAEGCRDCRRDTSWQAPQQAAPDGTCSHRTFNSLAWPAAAPWRRWLGCPPCNPWSACWFTFTHPPPHLDAPPPPRRRPAPLLPQLARELKLTTGPVAVVVPLSTFGSWEREMAK